VLQTPWLKIQQRKGTVRERGATAVPGVEPHLVVRLGRLVDLAVAGAGARRRRRRGYRGGGLDVVDLAICGSAGIGGAGLFVQRGVDAGRTEDGDETAVQDVQCGEEVVREEEVESQDDGFDSGERCGGERGVWWSGLFGGRGAGCDGDGGEGRD